MILHVKTTRVKLGTRPAGPTANRIVFDDDEDVLDVPTGGVADPLKPLLRPRDSFVPLVLPSTTLLVQLSVRDVTAVGGGDVDNIMCVEVKGDEFYDGERIAPRRGGSRSAAAGSAAQLEAQEEEIVIAVDPPRGLLSEESLS